VVIPKLELRNFKPKIENGSLNLIRLEVNEEHEILYFIKNDNDENNLEEQLF
jgi:hypothetical protein